MIKKSKYAEPVSVALRRRPHGNKAELKNVVRWVALVTLFLFLILTISYLLTGYSIQALVTGIGSIPVLIAFLLVQQDSVSLASGILATVTILLITVLASFGEGLYDIGILGYPVILIVTGLILRGRVIMYITLLTIACLGWLAFGTQFGLLVPSVGGLGYVQDFFVGSIIMLVAGNSIFRLTKEVYDTLQEAEQEIEARRQADARRDALIHQLRSKNQELDRFAIRVSHDLKSPLITLAGFLGYLERDIKENAPEKIERDLTQINQAAKSMGKFVDELLDLSRVGRIVNPPKDVAFDDILQDALRATDGLLKQKQVQVEIDAIFPFVHVDKARIVQVVQNLLVNAIKFMGDQPHPIIRVGFEEVAGEHVFSISDNGIGIAPENHERIFELFSKLNPEVEGTGIGLGLVKKIVEVHHGRVWVESELGRGAVFKFTLGSLRQI